MKLEKELKPQKKVITLGSLISLSLAFGLILVMGFEYLHMKKEFDTLKKDTAELKKEFDTLKKDTTELKKEFDTLKKDPSQLKKRSQLTKK